MNTDNDFPKRWLFLCVLFLTLLPHYSNSCTGLMLHTDTDAPVHGRTVEFGIKIDINIAMIPRQYNFVGVTPSGDGLKYKAKYAAVGLVAYKDIKILDGINEKGLSVAAFYFPGFAEYTPVTSSNKKKGLSPGDFPNWLLTQFETIEEVRKAVASDTVVITPTVIKGWGDKAPPFHYVVYEKSGKSLVIEPIKGKLVIHDNPLGVITNSPNFDWHMTNLRNYINLRPDSSPSITLSGLKFSPLGQGSGLLGLPGDFTPPSRFVRAAIFGASAKKLANNKDGILQLFHILNNFDIPLGAARGSEGGKTIYDYTMFISGRDPKNLRYYFRTYDDQSIRMVDLKAMNLNTKTIKLLSTKGDQKIVELTKSFK